MKTMTHLAVLLAVLIVSPSVFSANLTTVHYRHAVEISIGIKWFNPQVYRDLRSLIGKSIANGALDKFVIYGYAPQGGFSGCVEEPTSDAPPSADFRAFVKELNTLIGAEAWYKQIKSCFFLSESDLKPATVQVAKADGSISCLPNSGISLTDMRKKMSYIDVYSANKLHDGLIRIDVCGIETGVYNVYEIAVSMLNVAKRLGFVEWSSILEPNKIEF